MWISVSLSLHPLWDDLQWRAVAIWQDDDASEPVVLTHSGTTPLGDEMSPQRILAKAVQALEARVNAGATWMKDD